MKPSLGRPGGVYKASSSNNFVSIDINYITYNVFEKNNFRNVGLVKGWLFYSAVYSRAAQSDPDDVKKKKRERSFTSRKCFELLVTPENLSTNWRSRSECVMTLRTCWM